MKWFPLPDEIKAADLQRGGCAAGALRDPGQRSAPGELPRLGFVGTATIGTDHIDQGLLAARGIPFSAPAATKVSVGTTCSPPLVLAERHELTF